jgi:hypothetical protein
MRSILPRSFAFVLVSILAAGCATNQRLDYTEYKQIRPHSILVLPPLNNTPDVGATYSMLSQVTHPLAESGYYVFPVTLIDETFKQNGLTAPGDIHAVAPAKLQEIFGADAALYVSISKYGTTYNVISSESVVSASAKLVDLKTGKILWQGSASASSDEGRSNSGGLAATLISAIINQIASNVMDVSHRIAGVTSERLLSAGHPNGILYGPRSPKYGKD